MGSLNHCVGLFYKHMTPMGSKRFQGKVFLKFKCRNIFANAVSENYLPDDCVNFVRQYDQHIGCKSVPQNDRKIISENFLNTAIKSRLFPDLVWIICL